MSRELKVRNWGHSSYTYKKLADDNSEVLMDEVKRISERSLKERLPDATILSNVTSIEPMFDPNAANVVARIQFVSMALDFAEEFLKNELRYELKRELEGGEQE